MPHQPSPLRAAATTTSNRSTAASKSTTIKGGSIILPLTAAPVPPPPTKPSLASSSSRQPPPNTVASQYIVAFQHHMRRATKEGPTRMQCAAKPDLHMTWDTTSNDDWRPPSPRTPAEPLPPPRNVVCSGGGSPQNGRMMFPGESGTNWMTCNSLPMTRRPPPTHSPKHSMSPSKQRQWIDDALIKEKKKSLLYCAPSSKASLSPMGPLASQQRPATCAASTVNARDLVSHSQRLGSAGGKPPVSLNHQKLPWERDAGRQGNWRMKSIPTPPQNRRRHSSAADMPVSTVSNSDQKAVLLMHKKIQTGAKNVVLPKSIVSRLEDQQSPVREGNSSQAAGPRDPVFMSDAEILEAVTDPVLKNDLKLKKRLWRDLYFITKTALSETQIQRRNTERQISDEIQKCHDEDIIAAALLTKRNSQN